MLYKKKQTNMEIGYFLFTVARALLQHLLQDLNNSCFRRSTESQRIERRRSENTLRESAHRLLWWKFLQY